MRFWKNSKTKKTICLEVINTSVNSYSNIRVSIDYADIIRQLNGRRIELCNGKYSIPSRKLTLTGSELALLQAIYKHSVVKEYALEENHLAPDVCIFIEEDLTLTELVERRENLEIVEPPKPFFGLREKD